MDKDKLIDDVIEELKTDIQCNDTTAIAELLSYCDTEYLIGYLREEKQEKYS